MTRSKCRTALLALVAACALGATVVSSASAAETPEFVGTAAKAEGGTNAVTFFSPGGNRAEFTKSSLEGSFTTNKTMLSSVSLLFQGGGAEGTCVNAESDTALSIKGLDAKLGWINKAKNEIGLMFIPPKQPMTECRWRKENVWLAGEVIGKITPVGTKTSHFTVTFSVPNGEKDWELPEYFEGEKESTEVFPLAYSRGCELIKTKKGEVEDCSHNLQGALETKVELNTEATMEVKA